MTDAFARAKEIHYGKKKSWKVVLQTPLVTSFGERLFVAGSTRALGNWGN